MIESHVQNEKDMNQTIFDLNETIKQKYVKI